MDGSRHSEAVVTRLESLLHRPHISADYVRFRIELLKAQLAVCEALGTPAPLTRPLSPSTGGNGGPGEPPLRADAVPFSPSLLASLGTAIGRMLHPTKQPASDGSRLVEAATREPRLWEELAGRAAFGPDLAFLDSLGLRLAASAEALLFFGRALAAPFVTDAARRLQPKTVQIGYAPDGSGRCVVCGSPPALSRLRRDDGVRILYCSLCGTAYEYARLACPHCGTHDHEALTFLRLEAESPRWVESCERCRRYIKTVDERRLPEGEDFVPLAEDAGTLYLDLLAEKEGCCRGMPYAAVV